MSQQVCPVCGRPTNYGDVAEYCPDHQPTVEVPADEIIVASADETEADITIEGVPVHLVQTSDGWVVGPRAE